MFLQFTAQKVFDYRLSCGEMDYYQDHVNVLNQHIIADLQFSLEIMKVLCNPNRNHLKETGAIQNSCLMASCVTNFGFLSIQLVSNGIETLRSDI